MDLTINICTYNNCESLKKTLDSLVRCRIPEDLKWEVVVVNNNCTDQTDQVISKYKKRLPLTYLQESRPGLSFARNCGIENAQGKLIIFTDDDVQFTPDWLVSYWQAYKEKPQGYFFGGPIESRYSDGNLDKELINVAMPSVKGLDFGKESRPLGEYDYFIGPNWACPSMALRKIGAFDVRRGLNPSAKRVIVGEETDLMNRLKDSGWISYYVPGAKLLHNVPSQKCSLKHIRDRRIAWGYEVAKRDFALYTGKLLAGIPRWMYLKLIGLWGKFIWARLRLKKGYGEYLTLMQFWGIMLGMRELIQSNKAEMSK